MPNKGWKLITLASDNWDSGLITVDFAHYTGRRTHFGWEYDKVLYGKITPEQLRRALRRYLELQPGNKERR